MFTDKIFSSDNVQVIMQYMMDFIQNISQELCIKRSNSKNMLIEMA